MENLSYDLLAHLLTIYPTYREQYKLSTVCKLWYTIITSPPIRFDDDLMNLYGTISDDEFAFYTLLSSPIYRHVYITAKFRKLRNAIIEHCRATRLPYKLQIIVDKLCNTIDSDEIKRPDYWEIIRKKA